MIRLLIPLLAAFLLGPAALVTARAEPPTQNEMETALTCQCGCGLTVHSCNHLNCGSAIPLKQEIGEQIAMGRSLTEISSHFETKYGEKILSAPTTRGFNLAAWVVPFVAIGLGGLFIGGVLWRWRHNQGAAGEGSPSSVRSVPNESEAERALRARLERELRERDT